MTSHLTQKMTKMTSHYDPKNDQNDQSMTDYHLVMMSQKMTKMTSHYG